MKYICSKQGKIDKLWGRFIKHLLELEAQESRWNTSGKAK